jgi:hypothetical protein
LRESGWRSNGEKKNPPGWRSRPNKGALSGEHRAAQEHPGGRRGRNSGRGWDEINDYTIGGRGKPIAIAVNLKETARRSWELSPVPFEVERMRAQRQAYEYAVRVKFQVPSFEVNHVCSDYVILPTEVFNGLLELSGANQTKVEKVLGNKSGTDRSIPKAKSGRRLKRRRQED